METTRVLTKNGVENTNIDGARDNNFNAGGRSGIVKGVLNEGTFTAQGNEIVFDTCELRISGHRVVIEEPSRISLSGTPYSAERFQYIAKITNIDGEISFELITTLIHELEQDDILNGNGVYELEIGRFTHDTSGNITDVVRTADVITGGTGSGVDIDTLHPIGSVFITTDSTSPAALFANTTWEKITDKFLVGAGNLYEVGATGGSTTHKHAGGTLGAEVTISGTNIIINTIVQEDGYNYNPIAELTTTERQTYPFGQNYITPVIGNTAESNNLPPYMAVNIWKRVA